MSRMGGSGSRSSSHRGIYNKSYSNYQVTKVVYVPRANGGLLPERGDLVEYTHHTRAIKGLQGIVLSRKSSRVRVLWEDGKEFRVNHWELKIL